MGCRLSAQRANASVSRKPPNKADANAVQSFADCQFKLFEYMCPHCTEKRTLQYFYHNGCFLEQKPQVCCGACGRTGISPASIFKTAAFLCPECTSIQKVRLPALPVPLE